MADRGSQFFITLEETPQYDQQTTIFGIVRGETYYNIQNNISPVQVDEDSRPVIPIKIIKAEVLENPFDDIEPRPVNQRFKKPDERKEAGDLEKEGEELEGVGADLAERSSSVDEEGGETLADARAAPIHEDLEEKERIEKQKYESEAKYQLDPSSKDPFEGYTGLTRDGKLPEYDADGVKVPDEETLRRFPELKAKWMKRLERQRLNETEPEIVKEDKWGIAEYLALSPIEKQECESDCAKDPMWKAVEKLSKKELIEQMKNNSWLKYQQDILKENLRVGKHLAPPSDSDDQKQMDWQWKMWNHFSAKCEKFDLKKVNLSKPSHKYYHTASTDDEELDAYGKLMKQMYNRPVVDPLRREFAPRVKRQKESSLVKHLMKMQQQAREAQDAAGAAGG
mmetsp:Transcript_4366/g.7960  ORF Transcript_4366/g.7960 Transcript_4366/m.7960 type:complete len:396 (-) Transcript_4366:280-1467(-)